MLTISPSDHIGSKLGTPRSGFVHSRPVLAGRRLFPEEISDFKERLERSLYLIQELLRKSEHNPTKVFLHKSPINAVIAFVEALERAHHLLNFEDYLRHKCDIIQHDSSPADIYDTLQHEKGLWDIFNKVDKEDLEYTIEKHISEVRADRETRMLEEYVDYLNTCEFITPDSSFLEDTKEIKRQCKFLDLCDDKRKQVLEEYKVHVIFTHPAKEHMPTGYVPRKFCAGLHLIDREKRDREPSNPISNVLFRKRNGSYSMDLNPEVELEKIRRSNPIYYHRFLVSWTPPMKYTSVPSLTVRVTNLPFGVPAKTIKKIFSECGDIKYVKMTRGNRLKKSHTAYVGFKSSEAVDKARLKTGQEIDGRPVDIIKIPDSLLATSKRLMTKDVVAANALMSAVDEAGNAVDILGGVLVKYWKYSQTNFWGLSGSGSGSGSQDSQSLSVFPEK